MSVHAVENNPLVACCLETDPSRWSRWSFKQIIIAQWDEMRYVENNTIYMI